MEASLEQYNPCKRLACEGKPGLLTSGGFWYTEARLDSSASSMASRLACMQVKLQVLIFNVFAPYQTLVLRGLLTSGGLWYTEARLERLASSVASREGSMLPPVSAMTGFCASTTCTPIWSACSDQLCGMVKVACIWHNAWLLLLLHIGCMRCTFAGSVMGMVQLWRLCQQETS